MIFDSTHDDRFHVVLASDAADECPEPVFQIGSDSLATFLGTEDAMDQATDIGMCHVFTNPFNRPYGTRLICVTNPRDKSLGYFQLPLRGRNCLLIASFGAR